MDVLNSYGGDALSNMQKQLEQLRSQTYPAYNFSQPSSNVIWVQGMEGAKGYQVPNRSNTILLDSENEGTMYIVSSDEVGMRKMRVFRFEEVEVKLQASVDMSQYCTKEDVKTIILEMLSNKEETVRTKEVRRDTIVS